MKSNSNPDALKISNSQIEHYAANFLEVNFPRLLQYPTQTDITDILDFVKSNYRYDFVIKDLGDKDGSKILGSTNFKDKYIAVDESLFNNDPKNSRLTFIIAHEIGHCLIHSKHYDLLKQIGIFQESATDTINDFSGRKLFQNERDFLEHHASLFAANILIPTKTLRYALIMSQKRLGITRNFGSIYLDHNEYTKMDYNKTISELQNFYHTSRTMTQIRLDQLQLIKRPDIKQNQIKYGINKLIQSWGYF